jgi:hypothetical protein
MKPTSVARPFSVPGLVLDGGAVREQAADTILAGLAARHQSEEVGSASRPHEGAAIEALEQGDHGLGRCTVAAIAEIAAIAQ